MKLLKPFVAQPIAPAESIAEVIEEDVANKKQQFAELLLRNESPFNVAIIVYPNDMSKALRIANEWPNDPEVKMIMNSLKEEAEEFHFHPTKEQFARKLLNTAEEMLSVDPQTAHRYHESYRKMRWPDTGVTITDNRVTNNVMVVKDHGTPEEWEAKVVAQQRKLKADSIVSTVEKAN